ncbi:MAG: PHB depolymerase family esterase [Brachymonas denitrificans]|jgi:poly(hydroxyalkanoate) depolymerase family esterase|uniref:extracellular catalytic domain type 1 short-chain-length polyhydroxyalkanoate depolymerase n=1 Tax=Brachymonas denitrificans TaxID=28220 RepID=UPI001BCC3456|nr:PHB depolymerase family esterase [Brachymonas denitrificans]
MKFLQKARSILGGLQRRLTGRKPAPAATAPEVPAKGSFRRGHHEEPGVGSSHYKLYIPPAAAGGRRKLPLVVMLHGCTQNPDDFARGTGMNVLAREQGFYVLYPEQPDNRGLQRCWSWFQRNHQQPSRGEPALIAGITRAMLNRHAIDPDRVYIAGLSAGGAMAALVARLYPELFAALGVYAGMAPGAASGLFTAMMAMRRGGRSIVFPYTEDCVPMIVFQGDLDKVVHPTNAQHLVAACVAPDAEVSSKRFRANGRDVTRTSYRTADGEVMAESWLVHGCAHAWCGGHAGGSYTDPLGPNAAAEMVRFFGQHVRKPARAQAAVAAAA